MKKIISSLLAITTLGLIVSTPLQVKAEPVNQPNSSPQSDYRLHHELFKVYYRERFERHPILAGTYRARYEADREVQKLERRGLTAWIDVVSV